MRTLKTREAAALLSVSPNTLRTWERRFDFPKPRRSSGGHRLYIYSEVLELRDALATGLSISSAISVASQGIGADGHGLVSALRSFRADLADRAMEGSLALRSFEATLDDILLPGLLGIHSRDGPESAAWAFASRWGGEWLGRAHRLTPPRARTLAILVGDASGGESDLAAIYVRALELCCARGGCAVLTLPVRAVIGLQQPVELIDPNAVVIAGQHVEDHKVALWAYAVHCVTPPVPFYLFHRRAGENLSSTRALPRSPVGAHSELLRSLSCRDTAPQNRIERLSARARSMR